MTEAKGLKEDAKEELTGSIKNHEASIREIYSAVVALASIVDQSVDENGMIEVKYQYASELIHVVQLAAQNIANELQLMADNAKWYMEEVEKGEQTRQGDK